MTQPRVRGPQRRATAIAATIALLALPAWNALNDIWFAGVFRNGDTFVTAPITAATAATNPMIEGPTGGLPAGYTILGQPGTRFWFTATLALTLLAVVLRLGLFAVGGIVTLWLSRAAAIGTHSVLTGPTGNRRFITSGDAYQSYHAWVWILAGLLTALAVQITVANSVQRRHDTAAGKTPEPGVLDVFTNAQTAIVARYARTTDEQRQPVATTSAR